MSLAPQPLKLNVPFMDKERAKSLGARWSKEDKAWFAPAGAAPGDFAKWTSGQSERPKAARAVDLDKMAFALEVPFDQRDEAKSAGAVWDWSRKAYFAPLGKETALERFRVQPAISSGGSGDPEQLFAEALREAGLDVALPVMDGKPHRVPLLDGKRGSRDGAYIGYMDGRPSGFIQNWKTGLKTTWSCGAGERADMSPAHRCAWSAQLELARHQRDKALQEGYAAAAEQAEAQWRALPAAQGSQAYLERKGIEQHGARLSGTSLVIDARDVDGKLWTLQRIPAAADGKKLFLKGGRKAGCFHTIGQIVDGKPIAIAEGFATAASVHEATGYAVAVAFDAGNLLPVGKALAARYPSSLLAFMADNDRQSETNVGVDKARAAAAEVGGAVVVPVFPAGAPKATDWNDLVTMEGTDGASSQIRAGLRAEQSRAKREAVEALRAKHPEATIEPADWRGGRSAGVAERLQGGLVALHCPGGRIELHEARLLSAAPRPGARISIAYADGQGAVAPVAERRPETGPSLSQ